MSLPNYDTFINCDILQQTNVIDNLFEPSYSILRFTLRNKEFMQYAKSNTKSYEDLVELIRSRLLQISRDTQIVGPSSRDVDHLADIVSAHPRLGATASKLSSHSEKEQKKLQNSGDPPEVKQRLLELNRAYEDLYPGLRFVVFVNGRSRSEIIKVMEQRIASGNSWFDETRIAINELCDIARDRAKKWEMETPKCKY